VNPTAHCAYSSIRHRLSDHRPGCPRVGNMKLVAEYLADALKFESLAAQEKDEDLKLSLLQQATAYRKLAEKRAKELGKSVDDGR